MNLLQVYPQLNPWLDLVSKMFPAVVTLLLGTVALFVSYWQYQIAHQKLRFELFEKRLKIHENLTGFFLSVSRGAKADEELLRKVREDARFLFGSEINEYIESIWGPAFEMNRLKAVINREHGGVTDEAIEIGYKELKKILQLFETKRDEISRIFRPYLDFGSVQVKPKR